MESFFPCFHSEPESRICDENSKITNLQSLVAVNLEKGVPKPNEDLETTLMKNTRDSVQALVDFLLEQPTVTGDDVTAVKLTKPKSILPTAKSAARPLSLINWKRYTKSKGILSKKKTKVFWDEQLREYIPQDGVSKFAKKESGKSNNFVKNEIRSLRNMGKSKKISSRRVGVTTEKISVRDLETAIMLATAGSGCLDELQLNLLKEAPVNAASEITAGASRKRKLPALSSAEEKIENVESVLRKRPKCDAGNQNYLDCLEMATRFATAEGDLKRKKSSEKLNKRKLVKKPKGQKDHRKGGKRQGDRKRR